VVMKSLFPEGHSLKVIFKSFLRPSSAGDITMTAY